MKVFPFQLLIFWLFPFAAMAQVNWKLVKHENQVEIYVRDVPGSKLKELKMTVFFDNSLDAMYALLTDLPKQADYQFGCLTSKRIGKPLQNEQCYYQELYMPWPFTNRDGAFKQSLTFTEKNDVFYIETNAIPTLTELRQEYVRVPYMHSSWQLSAVNANKVKGEYYLSVDPGGFVPLWLMNLFIDRGPYESVLRMRKLLQNPTYKNSKVFSSSNHKS